MGLLTLVFALSFSKMSFAHKEDEKAFVKLTSDSAKTLQVLRPDLATELKKWIYLFLMLILNGAAFAQGLGSIESSAAYKRYRARPRNDLSMIIYLMDRFNVPDVEIKTDGGTFSSKKAFPYWKVSLNVSYEGETAEDWVRRYCYRSDETNQVIYMRIEGGDFRPARDLFLEEIERVQKL